MQEFYSKNRERPWKLYGRAWDLVWYFFSKTQVAFKHFKFSRCYIVGRIVVWMAVVSMVSMLQQTFWFKPSNREVVLLSLFNQHAAITASPPNQSRAPVWVGMRSLWATLLVLLAGCAQCRVVGEAGFENNSLKKVRLLIVGQGYSSWFVCSWRVWFDV